jgi:hypothetical protein
MDYYARFRTQIATQNGDCMRERLKRVNPFGAQEPQGRTRKLPDIGSYVDHSRGEHALPS